MKTPFKVGDRVAVYGTNQTGWEKIGWQRKTGTVVITSKEGWCDVRIDSGAFVASFHEKQLRHLRKKKRREWWLLVDGDGNTLGFNRVQFNAKDEGHEVVHVREVKK